MENDFILINPISPEILFKSICKITPSFKDYWEKEDNCFKDENGLGSLHGIFSEYSGFIKDYFNKINEKDKTNLFNFIEECVLKDPMSGSGISNAACTCFLENLAGEGDFSKQVIKYLGSKSIDYFNLYDI